MTVLGCIGHWYSQLLYLVPVAVMGGAVAHQRLRTRLRERRSERDPRQLGATQINRAARRL
jgi:hypothetical protein